MRMYSFGKKIFLSFVFIYAFLFISLAKSHALVVSVVADDTAYNAFPDSYFFAEGTDGFARISSVSNSVGIFIRCTNADCTTYQNTSSIPVVGDIEIGTDGYARILGTSSTDGLSFTRCTNADCSTSQTTVIAAGGSGVQATPMFELDASNFPRIVYSTNISGQQLKYLQCSNVDCSSSTTTNIVTTENANNPSMQLGTDGYGRVVYSNNTDSKYIQCTNISCSTRNTNTVITAGDAGELALSSSNLGRIITRTGTNGSIPTYVECTNASCSTKNTQNFSNTSNYMTNRSDIIIDNSGNARIIYPFTSGSYMAYVVCYNTSCSSNSDTALVIGINNGYAPKIYKGNDGYSRLLFGKAPSPYQLKFARCLNDLCTVTVPTVVSNSAASEITSTTARVGSTVNPNGAGTNVAYRYSTNNDACSVHGSTTTTYYIGSGASNVSPNSGVITGLLPGTTYYYCTRAVNSAGTTDASSNVSFTTAGGTTRTGILNFFGFETGDGTEAYQASTNATYSTSTKRSGAYALRLQSAGVTSASYVFANQELSGLKSVNTTSNNVYATYHMNLASAPSAKVLNFLIYNRTLPVARINIEANNTLTLEYYNSGNVITAVGSASTVLPLNTWHKVELSATNMSTPGSSTIELRLNGVVVASASNLTLSNASSPFGRVQLGSGATNIVLDYYLDDIAVSDTSYPGGGSVLMMEPDSAGTYSTGYAAVGAGSQVAAVTETPSDGATSYIESTALGDVITLNLQSAASAGVNQPIGAVKTVYNAPSTSSQAVMQTRLRSGSTNSDGYSKTDVAGGYSQIFNTDPNTGSAWTTNALDALQIGALNNSTGTTRITIMNAMVWQVPLVTPTGLAASAEQNLQSFKATLVGTANPNGSEAHGYFRLYASAPDCTQNTGGTRVPSSAGNEFEL